MPRGTYDPDRPQRIAAAAVAVISERGVQGLTHRAVAARAGVPLGSTTYHFKTLDDLLAAAVLEAKAATDAELEEWSASVVPEDDLVRRLTDYLAALLEQHWDRTVLEYDVYLAALRRPRLHALSHAWQHSLLEVLSRHADELTATALAMVSDGLLLQALVRGVRPERHDVENVLARVVG